MTGRDALQLTGSAAENYHFYLQLVGDAGRQYLTFYIYMTNWM